MRRAFTLFEILLCVTIIAFLVAMLLPAIAMVRDVSKRVRCASNERQLWNGMMAFTTDHNGVLLPWERAAGQDPTWWPAILLDYLEVNGAMMNGSTESRYSKKGYNVLADCPDWKPHGDTWNGFYTVWERDGKSLGYAYVECPTRDWSIGNWGFTNGFGGTARIGRITYPEQRLAFFESDDSRADPIPSRTVREGDWSSPTGSGGLLWKKEPRHRGRPNWVTFSGRIVSTTTQELSYWRDLNGTPFFKNGWLRSDTRDWRWGNSAFYNGLENPSQTSY